VICNRRDTSRFIPDPLILPWSPMTDSRIATLKTAGTVILLASGPFLMPGRWNGTQWVTESGSALDDPWKWMPMPEPISI